MKIEQQINNLQDGYSSKFDQANIYSGLTERTAVTSAGFQYHNLSESTDDAYS